MLIVIWHPWTLKYFHFVGECDFKQENMGQKHKNDEKFHDENLESKWR